MEGEDRQAWRVIQGYVSAQLQSRLVAVATATELGKADLLLTAAREFVRVGEIARRLSLDEALVPTTSSHNLRAIVIGLRSQESLAVQRTRRFPRVHGDESIQLGLIQELVELVGEGVHTVRFRQRAGRIIMTIMNIELRPELMVLGSRNPVAYALKETSLASALGLALARECANQRLGIHLSHNALHVHFAIVTQLTLPL